MVIRARMISTLVKQLRQAAPLLESLAGSFHERPFVVGYGRRIDRAAEPGVENPHCPCTSIQRGATNVRSRWWVYIGTPHYFHYGIGGHFQ